MPATVNNDFFLGFLVLKPEWDSFLPRGRPGMITKDFANHFRAVVSQPAHLANRVLSRQNFCSGRIALCTTWIPALILFFVKAELQGMAGSGKSLDAGSIVLSCFIWIAMISLISMAVAVWVKWRIAATALMLEYSFCCRRRKRS